MFERLETPADMRLLRREPFGAEAFVRFGTCVHAHRLEPDRERCVTRAALRARVKVLFRRAGLRIAERQTFGPDLRHRGVVKMRTENSHALPPSTAPEVSEWP